MRLIHISDLHCTSSDRTLDSVDGNFVRDFQNSTEKINIIVNLLCEKRKELMSNTIIISGDLTDSGDESDYVHPQRGAVQLIKKLTESGFKVYSVPGNHDYCKEGNQILCTDEKQRRERFVKYITPQYSSYPDYPHVEPLIDVDGIEKGRLILLDSMQGELDGNTDNHYAQGTLGDKQLQLLKQSIVGVVPRYGQN